MRVRAEASVGLVVALCAAGCHGRLGSAGSAAIANQKLDVLVDDLIPAA